MRWKTSEVGKGDLQNCTGQIAWPRITWAHLQYDILFAVGAATSIKLNTATVLLPAQYYLKTLKQFTAVSRPEAAVITSDHYGTADIGALSAGRLLYTAMSDKVTRCQFSSFCFFFSC
jgi:hypothetical protein